ncbi:MAG: YitT family protein [Candidatus Saccharimonadales bacterium]
MPIRIEHTKRIIIVLLGSIIAAAGLQFFLLPNHLLDGGVTGVSIISARLSDLPLGFFIILFNIPFIYLGYKKIGREFTIYSIIGIMMLALLTSFHLSQGFTDVPILAAIFGGIMIGIGVGIVIRYGGVIDGTDTVAVLIDRVTIFSVGEAIMFINGIIIAGSGFIFGWNTAMYSLVAYFVAHKAIDVTVEGLNESRSVWIVSMHVRDIGKIINQVIDEPVTYIKESNPKDREPHGIILAVITRFEEQKIKTAIHGIDPNAFIVISNAHEIIGKEIMIDRKLFGGS